MTDERLAEIKGTPHKTHEERDLIAEIDRLRAENAAERKRAEVWKAECTDRVNQLRILEWSDADRGWLACPDCEGAMPDDPNFADWHATHPKYHEGHYAGCDLARLMTMPEEPKP